MISPPSDKHWFILVKPVWKIQHDSSTAWLQYSKNQGVRALKKQVYEDAPGSWHCGDRKNLHGQTWRGKWDWRKLLWPPVQTFPYTRILTCLRKLSFISNHQELIILFYEGCHFFTFLYLHLKTSIPGARTGKQYVPCGINWAQMIQWNTFCGFRFSINLIEECNKD